MIAGSRPRGVARLPAPVDRLGLLQVGALWIVALAGGVIGYIAFSEYVFEDAYITLRYAANLAEGRGFVFTPGERVMGTTTPLLALLLAGCGLAGANIEVACDVVFAACLTASSLLGGGLVRRWGFPSAAILVSFALASGFGHMYEFWGLETPLLVASILAGLLAAEHRRDTLAGAMAGVAFLTRYDAALFAIALHLYLWVSRRRLPLRPALATAALALPWLGFAQVYFGTVLPNTLGAKAGDVGFGSYLVQSARTQLDGAWALLAHAPLPGEWIAPLRTALHVLIGVGLLVALLRPALSRGLVWPILGFAGATWIGYSLIGPPLAFDWYLVPASTSLMLLGTVGLAPLFAGLPAERLRALAVIAFAASGSCWLAGAARAEARARMDDDVYRGRVEAYAEIAEWILANRLGDLTLLTLEPGYLTYRTGNPVIDGAGLVTKGVYFHGAPERHTSFQDLIASRSPELVICSFPYNPPGYTVAFSTFPSCRLLMRRAVFAERGRRLRDTFADPRRSREFALRHPFHLDAEEGTRSEWRRLGGWIAQVGTPLPLHIGDVPVTDPYLHLGKNPQAACTPRFLIDFDRLTFRFAASTPRATVAQLVIDGQVVLEQGGIPGGASEEFALVSWPVTPWKDRVAELRFLTRAKEAEWLAADHIRSIVDAATTPVDDFEAASGYADVWQSTLGDRPTELGDLVDEFGLGLLVSPRAATTHGLESLHAMITRPFTVEHDFLSFILFDFSGPESYARLLAGGEVVREVLCDSRRRAHPVFWSLRDLRGREVVLEIRDGNADPRSWVGLDEVRFVDPR